MNLTLAGLPVSPSYDDSLPWSLQFFAPNKGPKMRPIMGARVGPNTGLSQIGSRILRSINDEIKIRHDVKSTEEMLEKIERFNKFLMARKSKKKFMHP